MHKFKISLQYTFLIFTAFAICGLPGLLGLVTINFIQAQTGLHVGLVAGVVFGLYAFALIHFRVEYNKLLDWFFKLISAVEKEDDNA